VSRNALSFESLARVSQPPQVGKIARSSWLNFFWRRLVPGLSGVLLAFPSFSQTNLPILPLVRETAKPPARVVIVQDRDATDAFQPRNERVVRMVNRGIETLTGKLAPACWRSLVSTQDVVGIKVYASPGPDSGTRPALAAAVVEGLLGAKIPPRHIIIWDKQVDDLRQAGFFDLATRYGVRVEAAAAAGYDEKTFYAPDEPILGNLVWGDSEFGRKGDGVGRKSFVSKLVSKGMTKIINLSPLLNHYRAGVSGNLYSLAMGSVDNTLRFETDTGRLAKAVPEIYALPVLGDRVVLNIVDALICQYEGEHSIRLHASAVLNEVRLSTDPVALDVLSLQELERQRQKASLPATTNRFDLYSNASELELGISDAGTVQVERLRSTY
jgi:hypothetical protein